MTINPRKLSHGDALWNVSLLPTVKTTPDAAPPLGPHPSGGRALRTPALLSISEDAAPRPLQVAA